MPKRLELKGKRFGGLTVTNFAHMKNGVSWWICLCDCGNEKAIRGNHLTQGRVISCGCKNEYNKKNITNIAKKNFKDGTSMPMLKSNKVPKSNSSGYKGVSFDKQSQKWRAYIVFKGRQIELGRYENIADATKARKKAEEEYYQPILRCMSKNKINEKKIESMQKLAQERGGKCLSTKYIRNDKNLKWECSKGHQWDARPANIKNGSWCPICSRTMKLTIEDMQKMAEKHGGKCLSTEYINLNKKLEWECKEGHQWQTMALAVRQGSWCPVCANEKQKRSKQKLTIKDMQKMAEEHGGKCLSTEYINAKSVLKWECNKGHQWDAAGRNIREGSWCPICSGVKKKTIEEVRNLAKERGGKCLSTKYLRADKKLKWECDEGHQWEATTFSIEKRGSWCPICANKQRKLTIEDMQKMAEEHGGKCLSTTYLNVHEKLEWECKKGHQWQTTPKVIRKGSWCPICRKKNGEVK